MRTSNSNNEIKDAIMEKVLPYIPQQIVIYPPTKENVDKYLSIDSTTSMPRKHLFCEAEDKTIQNFKEKVFNEVIKNDPSMNMHLLKMVEGKVEYLLSSRIVIGTK